MVTLSVLLLVAALQEPRSMMQEQEIHFQSCPAADSALGPIDRIRRPVRAGRDTVPPRVVSFASGPIGRVVTSVSVEVSVHYPGPGPLANPGASLSATVVGDRQLERETWASDTLTLRLVLDDSEELNLGRAVARITSGQRPPGFVPLAVRLEPPVFLALSRAHKAKLRIGSRSYDISRVRLEEISTLYRAVVCVPADSVPIIKYVRPSEIRLPRP